jgi:general secretion pathway protein G
MRVNACHNGPGGFTLIEMIMVIVIIGILATIATINLGSTLETTKYEATKAELDALARAIVGSPETHVAGARSDFGYVGDVGALPPDLDALTANPGYATWDGPYISADFDPDDFKKDAWGMGYVYFGATLRSVGSGSNIDKVFAPDVNDLLANTVYGCLLDAGGNPPGATYADSISIELPYPDGSGGIAIARVTPQADGYFTLAPIPMGNRVLRIVFVPEHDTTSIDISVCPGKATLINVTLTTDLW